MVRCVFLFCFFMTVYDRPLRLMRQVTQLRRSAIRPNTQRQKSPKHGSAEETRVIHFNQVPKLPFDSTLLAPCMLGRMCHQASTSSHRDARGMVVSTELCSCTRVCTHQMEKRQVGAQQAFAITCATCETCQFLWPSGIRGSTREEDVVRMHGLDNAIHRAVQSKPQRKTGNSPSTTNDPTHL